MALDGKVKLPIVGEMNKKTAVYGGVAAAAIAAVIVWRARQKAAQAQQTAEQQSAQSAMVTDPAGNQCTSLAPSGYCPGSPQDQAASQDQTAFAGGGGTGYGGYGGGYGGGGFYGGLCPDGSEPSFDQFGNEICPPSTGTTTATYANNEQWVQAVEKIHPNWGQALGKVLAGLTVTNAQKDQFLEAVALFNAPPEGYPTPIKTSDTSGHPGNGHKADYVIANGIETLQIIATENHITIGKIVELNPHLARYAGTNKPVPKGTRVRVS